MRKKVVIIGAGVSGLTAIKSCLEEGLEPICFEKMSTIGGLWQYRDKLVDGVASVMKSTIINTSKEMMSFSDFPPPKEFANYMHNRFIVDYFKLYVDKFDLERHIHFNTEVMNVVKSEEMTVPVKWIVTWKNKITQEIKEDIYDFIMVCTGHHVFPYLPSYSWISTFKGQVLHSHEYKCSAGFEDKRILIIGFGNSALDAAVELSRAASQVYLSTRRGAWILNRVQNKGRPADFSLTRFNAFLSRLMPGLLNKFMEKKLNDRFDHAMYGIKPKHSPFSQHVTISDDLPNRIISGTVIIKPGIKSVTDNNVVFEDDTTISNIDVILFCTGYEISFPCIAGDVIPVNNNKVQLFKFVFPIKSEFSSLAVIGLIQPIGAIMPISELQCRLVTKVFTNQIKLPDEKHMLSDYESKIEAMAKRYVASPRHTIQVDYVPYMDEIAEMISVKPNLMQLFLTDPKLALICLFGPCLPYQYRLHGPGKWPGAGKAILETEERMQAAFKSRLGNEIRVSEMGCNIGFRLICILTVVSVLTYKMFF